MSAALQLVTRRFTPASPEALAQLDRVHRVIAACEQIEIATEHLLHGGMYARTIRLAPETVMEGSLVQRATVLIVHGATAVHGGEAVVELAGYNVIAGSAGRKQVFVTRSAVEMTMIFPTAAKTVEKAEDEVFAEAELLMSRADGSRDTITVTGE